MLMEKPVRFITKFFPMNIFSYNICTYLFIPILFMLVIKSSVTHYSRYFIDSVRQYNMHNLSKHSQQDEFPPILE